MEVELSKPDMPYSDRHKFFMNVPWDSYPSLPLGVHGLSYRGPSNHCVNIERCIFCDKTVMLRF